MKTCEHHTQSQEHRRAFGIVIHQGRQWFQHDSAGDD